MSQHITAWSYSRWSTYEECPFKAKLKFIEKRQEPPSDAMARGERIHKAIERYLVDGGRVPTEAKPMAGELRVLKALRPVVEGERAFSWDWKPVDWFSKEAWCRVKADAFVLPVADDPIPTVRTIDHKTGKLKDAGEYDAQLEIYGLAGLLSYSMAAQATGELWFIDHGKIVQRPEGVFPRKDEKSLKKLWEGRVKKMLSDTRFEPRPGNYCRYCHFRKANNGPCKY